VEVTSAETFFEPLRQCINKHPMLCVLIKDQSTEKAYYERAPKIDLKNHISILPGDLVKEISGGSELPQIEKILPDIADRPWATIYPPWRIVALPLPPSENARCLIVFSFSHGLGDGINGLAFHHSLLEAFRQPMAKDNSPWVSTPDASIAPAFDTPERLPISWSYLLAPLLAVLLPNWMTRIFGLRASASHINPGTWTGPPMFFDPCGLKTSDIKLLEINKSLVEKALTLSRENGAKLTAVVHQIILRSLSKQNLGENITNFVSQTAVSMRPAVGVSRQEMGLYVNGWYDHHPRIEESGNWTDAAWVNARCMTGNLAKCAVTLKDQPIGLLRYAPSIRKWLSAKIGQQRDCSYEVSNLGTFSNVGNDRSESDPNCARVTKMLFAHSAQPISAPIIFNIVGVQEGGMVISVLWQRGALGVSTQSEEAFINDICKSVLEEFENLK
jgi:hypothetical protein